MKHYIFILAMLLNAVAIHAQEPMSIPQLMEYLEKNYPEGMYGGISNYSKTMHENISWGKSYERDKDKPIDKYHLELLKDSILQCFIHASETAIASLYQQTSNGTEDTIRYALALDTLGGNWELIQPEHRNFHYKSLPTIFIQQFGIERISRVCLPARQRQMQYYSKIPPQRKTD